MFEENLHGDNGPGTVKALFLRIGLPICFVLILIIGCLFSLLFPLFAQCQCLSDIKTGTFFVIAFVAILSFSFSDLSLELMKAFNCIRVDETQSDPPNEYDIYALEKASVWVEDPTLYCSEGDHKHVENVGIVGLFVLSLPVLFLFFWIVKRIKTENDSSEGGNHFGVALLLREFLSELRKGLVASAVIFAARRGTNLQGALSLGILVVILAIHWASGYFILSVSEGPRGSSGGGWLLSVAEWGRSCLGLQALEAVSLLTSISVFHSAILFGDPDTTETLKITLEIAVLTLNAGFMLVALFLLLTFFGFFISESFLSFYSDKDNQGGTDQ